MAVDVHAQDLGQVHLIGKEQPENSADEADHDRDEKSATRPAANRPTDGAADASDDQQHD
jgi:hypothetical protein